MVDLIFAEDDDVLSKPGVVRTIYDPTAGTGGMLSVVGEWVHEHNPRACYAFGTDVDSLLGSKSCSAWSDGRG